MHNTLIKNNTMLFNNLNIPFNKIQKKKIKENKY